MDRSIGAQLAEMLDDSPLLRARVLRAWAHTYGDTRGLRDWVRAVELRDPRLRWHEEDRGKDRLVWPEVDAPPPISAWWADCGLRTAKDILWRVVRRHWRGAHRYHWQYPAAQRRYHREREALEAVFHAAVEDVWLELARDAIARAFVTPIWLDLWAPSSALSQYHVGTVQDGEVRSGRWAPVSPAAWSAYDQACAALPRR
jgi:hypothetical protein